MKPSETDDTTPFSDLVDDFGWKTTHEFIAVYAAVARRIGETPQITARQVRRWRQPNPPCPHPPRQRVLEAMLGVPLEQLGFDVPAHRRNAVQLPEPPLVEGPHDSVDRRHLIAAASGVTLGSALTAASPTPTSAPHVSTDTITDLRTGLASLYGLDDRFGGATVGPLAAAHLSRVERLITTGHYPDTIGRQLRLISGETAEHVGWLAFDEGNHAQARRYWGKAMARAEELRDDSLAVVVLASQSLLALRQQDPHNAIAQVSRAYALAEPWAPPSLLSILVTREAWALAALGDHTSARQSLSRAARLYEQDQGSRPAPDWTLFHGPAEIARVQATLFTKAGHHRAAVNWLRRSLERQEAVYARNEALSRGHLARALVAASEPEEAAHQVTQGEALLTEVSSGRARELLDTARQALAATHPKTLPPKE